jgi:DNA-binding transcriptional ArsR family regulator/energy-coupling factor transporter ATP-binding protein EcfA2
MEEEMVDPFYSGEIPEDKVEILFVTRNNEVVNYISTLLATTNNICIPILGNTGFGKSSMLNLIAVIGKTVGLKVFKVRVDELADEKNKKRIEDTDILLIDDVDKLNDSTVLSSYSQIEEYVKAGKRVFFSDTIQRKIKIVKERDRITTGKAIILPDLTSESPLDIFVIWVRMRMKKCRYKYVAEFSEDAIGLAVKRSKGNIRNFYRYCGMAYKYAYEYFCYKKKRDRYKEKGQENMEKITIPLMERAILAVDANIISSLDELSKIILKVLCEKERTNASELLTLIKEKGSNVSQRTVYKKLEELIECDLVVKTRVGHESLYSTIYHEIGMDVDPKTLDKIQDDYIYREPIDYREDPLML